MEKRKQNFFYFVLNFLGGILFVSWFLENRKTFSWFRVFLVIKILGLLVFGIAVFSVWNTSDSTFLEKSENCAVVFGAAVWRDDIPSHALEDRTMAGISLYKKQQVSCLIFSGGASKFGTHEAEVMKKIAVAKGVPANDIFLDYRGVNTLATLKNLPKNAEKLVFVSNGFHLARIGVTANRLGIKNFFLHSAPYLHGKYIKESYFFMREVLGVIFYFFCYWE